MENSTLNRKNETIAARKNKIRGWLWAIGLALIVPATMGIIYWFATADDRRLAQIERAQREQAQTLTVKDVFPAQVKFRRTDMQNATVTPARFYDKLEGLRTSPEISAETRAAFAEPLAEIEKAFRYGTEMMSADFVTPEKYNFTMLVAQMGSTEMARSQCTQLGEYFKSRGKFKSHYFYYHGTDKCEITVYGLQKAGESDPRPPGDAYLVINSRYGWMSVVVAKSTIGGMEAGSASLGTLNKF